MCVYAMVDTKTNQARTWSLRRYDSVEEEIKHVSKQT